MNGKDRRYADYSIEEVIAFYQQGDNRAFDEIAGRVRGLIYNWIKQREITNVSKKEIFQLVLIRLSIQLKKNYKEQKMFYGWLKFLVDHLILNEQRRKGNNDFASLENIFYCTNVEEDNNDSYEREMRMDILEDAMKKLPKESSKLLVEHYLLGHTYQAMADKVGCKLVTMVKRVQRSVIKLRNIVLSDPRMELLD